LIKGGNITLFSPSDVPAFLYERVLRKTKKNFDRPIQPVMSQGPIGFRKQTIKATELFTLFALSERAIPAYLPTNVITAILTAHSIQK